METTSPRHLPCRTKPGYTEAMCGKVITDTSMICHDRARVTCARCVDNDRSEAFAEQDRFYESGQW